MRYLTLLMLATLFAGAASSQGRFGVKAGLVLNYINTEGISGGTYSDVNTGFTFGFSYSMMSGKNFAVQPELNYVKLSGDEGITNSTARLQYIQIPVLLKGMTSNQNFNLYIGPQLSFLTDARMETPSGKRNIREDVTETLFDGVVGFEYITSINLTLNVRYVHSFSNVFKAEFDTFKSRHQYGAITIGYLFGKKTTQ